MEGSHHSANDVVVIHRESRASRQSADDIELNQLGYEQTLHRGLSAFSNFAFGFTEVAVLVSFTSQYGYGLQTGGKSGTLQISHASQIFKF